MTGVAEMFAELDGYQRYFDALNARAVAVSVSAVERTAQWRIDNPRRYRALRRRCAKNWAKRNPDKRRAGQQRQRDRNREKHRARWRKSSKAYRARKKARTT